MSLFAALDRLKADLDALRPLAPEQEQRVLQKFRLDWNYNSNAIEGNSLTLGETRSLLLHGLTAAGKPMRDHLDIKGHNEAVLWLEDFVRDERPLTEQFIRGMHEVLLGEAYEVPAQTPDGQPTHKTIQPGQYKTNPNNVLTATGEMFYFATPEETPAKMTDLVDWYRREDAAPTMHPVALAAEFHYRFVRIHPFGDGNGRMSRLLMNLILLRRGYAITVIKATDRNRYLAALSEADAGDPEPFLRFIIENVEASLQLMIRAAQGESIDEPDDLDKKLALLKKQVLSRNDAVHSYWNHQTQAVTPDSLIIPWISDLSKQTARFDELFIQKRFDYHFQPHRQTLFPNNPNNTEAKAEFQQVATRIKQEFEQIVSTVEVFSFGTTWMEFRQRGSTLSLRLIVNFRFSRYDFEVELRLFELLGEEGAPQTLLKAPYRTEYDHARIHEINHQLANKVYDFIAAKVAAADASPS